MGLGMAIRRIDLRPWRIVKSRHTALQQITSYKVDRNLGLQMYPMISSEIDQSNHEVRRMETDTHRFR